jgi:glucose/mannose-6-phosphate isomerase
MLEAIKSFNKQFEYEPTIKNVDALKSVDSYVVVGMGGSGHAADILKTYNPHIKLDVHRNYGLPFFVENKLIIFSSYSGNTEEVLDAFSVAQSKDLPMAVITTDGKLLNLAVESKVAYIQLPDTGIQPRASLGFQIMALTKIMGDDEAYTTAKSVSHLDPMQFEKEGAVLAKKLKGKVPIIYASERNSAIANNWKIKFNETGKIPAFYNVFPELNHNEINSFSNKDLSNLFSFIFLADELDHVRIKKRMQVLCTMYKDQGLDVAVFDLKGENSFHKIFSSLLIADWASFYTAKSYDLDPTEVPIVENFKKHLNS